MLLFVVSTPAVILAQTVSPSPRSSSTAKPVASETPQATPEEDVVIDPLLEDGAVEEVVPTPVVKVVDTDESQVFDAALATVNTLWGTVATFLSLVIGGLILKLVQLKRRIDERK